MGIFGRRRDDAGLPRDIVSRVLAYGRFQADPQNASMSGSDINKLIYEPLYPLASRDPAAFTRDLAAALLPAGGEAARGGERLVADLISGDFKDPNYDAMMDAALRWLRGTGVSSARLTGYEWGYWCQNYGADQW